MEAGLCHHSSEDNLRDKDLKDISGLASDFSSQPVGVNPTRYPHPSQPTYAILAMDGLLCPKGRIPKMGTTGWRTGWWCRDHPDYALDAVFFLSNFDRPPQEEFDAIIQLKVPPKTPPPLAGFV